MNDYPIPPGAPEEQSSAPEPEVIRATPAAAQAPEETPGALRRLWNFVSETTSSAVSFIGGGLGTVFGYAAYGVTVAYEYTLKPVLDIIERYVPFAGQIRSASRFWFVITLFIGAVIGALVAAEAGAGVVATIGLILFGIVIIPWIIATNPALWPAIALDLWIISTIWTFIDTVHDKVVEGKPFFKCLLFRAAPGIVEALAPAGTVNPVTGEVLKDKVIVDAEVIPEGAPA